MKDININLSDEEISQFSKTHFKSLIKNKMRDHVFTNLKVIKSDNLKVRDIIHTDLKRPQHILIMVYVATHCQASFKI